MFKQTTQIALLNINGTIQGGSGSKSLLGGNEGADTLLTTLNNIASDPKIKGVILRINSPGGSAAASQEIYELIEEVRAKGKYVIASLADVAASGGYMIAAACDKIIASPSTITGSIGVIFELPYYKEIADSIGYQTRIFKAGKLKDIGNPFRDMTQEESDLLQGMVLGCHKEFIDLVAKGRKMDIEKVTELADGRIFTGRQAYENGLVDELGNINTVLRTIKEKLSISNIKIKEYKPRRSLISSLLNLGTIISQLKAQILSPIIKLR